MAENGKYLDYYVKVPSDMQGPFEKGLSIFPQIEVTPLPRIANPDAPAEPDQEWNEELNNLAELIENAENSIPEASNSYYEPYLRMLENSKTTYINSSGNKIADIKKYSVSAVQVFKRSLLKYSQIPRRPLNKTGTTYIRFENCLTPRQMRLIIRYWGLDGNMSSSLAELADAEGYRGANPKSNTKTAVDNATSSLSWLINRRESDNRSFSFAK